MTAAHYTGTSTDAQRKRLLDVLNTGISISTIEARRDLDIMMPAARVFELRAEGCNIATYWAREPTESGKTHRVARYALLAGEGR
jgi:hypothetical protein